MQTLTFTQKLLRQRSFFNFLIPLFAVFVGLGASHNALAQNNTINTASNVTLNVRGTTANYDTRSNGAGPTIFNQQDFGNFNIGTDVFAFNGAEIRLSENATRTFARAEFRFRVFAGNLNSPSTANNPAFTDIELVDRGATNGIRTFSLSGASINLLNGIAGSSAGTSYRFDVRYRTTQTNGTAATTAIKESVFTAVLAPAPVSTVTLRNVVVTSGTTSANATTNTYDATATTPGPGVFNGTDFGTLDVSAGRLLLQGGSIQIAERNGDMFDAASIAFVVAPGTLAGPAPGFGAGQTLALAQTGYDAATMTRTFSLSDAARNILAMAMTGGAGTSYRFDVAVSASGMNAANNPISILGPRQASVFTASGAPTITPTLTSTTILISPSNSPNVAYDANNVSANPDFDGANLGTYDIANGQLVLNGGTATTTENAGNVVSNVTLYFRVRQTGNGGGSYTPLALTQRTVVTNGDGSRTRTFSLSNAAQNLLATVTAASNYNVDVYLEASYGNSADGTFGVATDRSNVAPYTANFTVNGTPVVTTVWTGGLNDNWFDPLNWTDGVPNAGKNAVIPNFNSGTPRPYPNIYSDAAKAPTPAGQTQNPDGTFTPFPADPGYQNFGSGNAQTRNLVLQGNSQLDRSILRLIIGRLDVFGNFDNPHGSFIQRNAGIISFKSQGNQTISGSPNGFIRVEIDGGVNSVKTLTNNFEVKAGGSLRFINGILQTNTANIDTNFVTFEGDVVDASDGTPVPVPAARLLGETEISFFRGFLRTNQVATVGVPQDFSNIGLTLTFTGNEPGGVLVTRNNGDNYPPSAFGGNPPKPGIRRVFGVQPNNPNTNSGGLNARLAFRFLDNELVNLRTNNENPADFSGSVDESRLSLYVSTTGGNTFFQLGRDSNSDNILVENGVTTFATFTLSEQQGALPLPVTLTTFNAERMGADALITWETASEFNSKGFEVQVSTDGQQFRTLGSVASATANSTKKTNYRYVDTEANKVGTRYYRLRQIDVNGKDAFFNPRTVLFTGKALATAMVAYPNPINGSELRLVLQSVVAGKGQLRITDMTGRVIRQESIELTSGISDLSVKNLGDLKAGLYLVGVTLPTGETQNLKIVKQ